MKNRKIVAKNRSGGIILGYRQEIASKIKPLHTNSKYVFWFKVSSDLVNLDQDIIFGVHHFLYIALHHIRDFLKKRRNRLRLPFVR
jgi:hypothetical protein